MVLVWYGLFFGQVAHGTPKAFLGVEGHYNCRVKETIAFANGVEEEREAVGDTSPPDKGPTSIGTGSLS